MHIFIYILWREINCRLEEAQAQTELLHYWWHLAGRPLHLIQDKCQCAAHSATYYILTSVERLIQSLSGGDASCSASLWYSALSLAYAV